MAGLTSIHVEDFGYEIRITVEEDGSAANISGYATRQYIFRKPDGTNVTKTATYVTDGTDGVLTYTVESGVIDTPGNWKVSARVIDGATEEVTSEAVSFYVEERLD